MPMPSMQRVSPEEVLHVAVCQAVGLMNGALVFAQSEEGQQVRNILRTALTEYADAYMDQPVTEAERAAMIRGHANSAVDVEAARADFERWIKSPPYEHMCDRYSDQSAWPGQYNRYETQLAWGAWQKARAIGAAK